MLNNKTILITGATDGIGKQTALHLADLGAELILHGKDRKKGNRIKKEIIERTQNNNVCYFNADFTSFSEIASLSEDIHKQFTHIDILINNAGIFEKNRVILQNGIEKNFMVNHLAGFSLTLKCLDLLKKAPHTQIINVSSMIHANAIDFENLNGEKYYSGDHAYSMTKLCNILFTYELSDILHEENIQVNALHPGVIDTKLLRAGWENMGDNPGQGAKRILHIITSNAAANVTGKFFMNDTPVRSAEISYDHQVRKKLWDLSLKYIID